MATLHHVDAVLYHVPFASHFSQNQCILQHITHSHTLTHTESYTQQPKIICFRFCFKNILHLAPCKKNKLYNTRSDDAFSYQIETVLVPLFQIFFFFIPKPPTTEFLFPFWGTFHFGCMEGRLKKSTNNETSTLNWNIHYIRTQTQIHISYIHTIEFQYTLCIHKTLGETCAHMYTHMLIHTYTQNRSRNFFNFRFDIVVCGTSAIIKVCLFERRSFLFFTHDKMFNHFAELKLMPPSVFQPSKMGNEGRRCCVTQLCIRILATCGGCIVS